MTLNFVDAPKPVEFHDVTVGAQTPNLREVYTSFGETIRLERRNPYGFVYVVWHHGAAPETLGGSYSDFDTAREAVVRYLSENTFQEVVAERVEKTPPLQVKKAYRPKEN